MSSTASRRIVVATFGSLGDLHPYLALAVELRERGHDVVFATAQHYGERIRALGFTFEPLGPPVSPEDPEILHRLMRTARGPEYLFRKLFLPHLPELYSELERICVGADLLIASEVVFAAPILAEKTGIPWVSVLLSPISFLSPHDPPVFPPFAWTEKLRDLPFPLQRMLMELPAMTMNRWGAPLQAFRKQLGLPQQPDAMTRGKLRANLVLALFSKHFATAQPDWPANTVQPGFAFYDQEPPATPEREEHAAKLERFLAAGEAPVVFTLGSAAVHAPGNFFRMAATVAHRLGKRAVLLGGNADLRDLEWQDLLAIPYANHAKLFPRALGIVHHGGVGTTAEALRSGVPSMIVPFHFDQPDNAARVRRLGAALTIPRSKFNTRRAYYGLHRLLRDRVLHEKAAELGKAIRAEGGTVHAVDAIERLLSTVQAAK